MNVSEKEKMLKENYFDPRDVNLKKARYKTRKLLEKYNKLSFTKEKKREIIIKKIINTNGNCKICSPFFVIMVNIFI